jgi:membrane-bound lytic murein transglycosylase D
VMQRRDLPRSLGLIALVALGACAGAPERASTDVPGAPAPAALSATPAMPNIPEPVPVEVPATGSPEAAEAAALAAGDGAAAPESAAQEPAPVGNLLDRVRAGLTLGEHFHSRIDKEADWFARNPEYVERVFNRAAPYLHYIVHEVEKRGLPMELALLPVIESAFQPFAYSSARAMGLWQFIPTTGTRFNMKQDWWYDGRRDVVAATQGALDYLTYLNEHFDGDWLHAIAAYNSGEGNVARSIRRAKSAKKRIDFWNLSLPSETKGYVPRLLAMARIVAEPEKYGLSIEGIPDRPYFVQVETGGQISIEVAAELAGITTEQMYDLNPAYHRWATDPTGPHQLLVPVESAEAFRESLLLLTPDQRLRVERYMVREGDTVANISQRFGTTAQHLRELNQLGSASTVVIGSELRVPSKVSSLPDVVRVAAARVDARLPGAVRAVHVVRSGDTLSGIAKRYKVGVSTLARLNGIKSTSILRVGQRIKLHSDSSGLTSGGGALVVSADGQQLTYVVKRGDTLSGIARTLKVSVTSLRSWNNLTGSTIKPGQRLVAYRGQGS